MSKNQTTEKSFWKDYYKPSSIFKRCARRIGLIKKPDPSQPFLEAVETHKKKEI